MLSCLLLIVGNLIADLLYYVADPASRADLRRRRADGAYIDFPDRTRSFPAGDPSPGPGRGVYDRSALSRVWAALRANRLAMVCLVLMIIIIAASILAPPCPPTIRTCTT